MSFLSPSPRRTKSRRKHFSRRRQSRTTRSRQRWHRLHFEPLESRLVLAQYVLDGTLFLDGEALTYQDTSVDWVTAYDEVQLINDTTITVVGSVDFNASNLRIDATSKITANGGGHGGGGGPGTGGSTYYSGGGAGHGGSGDPSWDGVSGGTIYGDALSPTALGSGGGSSYLGSGGSGGGAIRIDVSGVFALDGEVSSNGNGGGGHSTSWVGGGGSGGSIWIATSSFSGAGLITANGGSGGQAGGRLGGGGAGGRVAVYYTGLSFTGSMQARGGVGALQGEDGTIVWNGTISGLSDTGNPMTTAVVTGRHYLSDTQSYAFENLVVASGGQLVLKSNYTGTVTVLDSLTVESGGEIYVERYGALTIGGGDQVKFVAAGLRWT